jgi:peptide/nickel transport system substrate-binding protein
MSLFVSFYSALSRREKMIFFSAIIGVLLGLTGVGGLYISKNTHNIPASGGSYREGIVGQPAFVNPVVAKSAADKSLARLLFASTADLASSIETVEQGKLVKIHLKDGMRWSDGQEITSDDIIFTVESIQNPDTASPLAPAWQGVQMVRVSKLEVDFKLPTAYVFFEDNVRILRPIPKHLFSEIPPANWKLSDYNLKPVTSGPYSFVARNVNPDGFVEWYRLRANPAAKEPALIETLDLVFARNEAELVKGFNTGTIDGFFMTDPAATEDVQRPYQEVHFHAPTYYAVFWNETANSALGQPGTRTALEAAINREQLIKEVAGEHGEIATDPLSPAFLPPLAIPTSTPSAAEILEKSGWKKNAEGILEKEVKKAHIPLEFTLTVPDSPTLIKTAEFLKARWEEVGARVEIEKVPLRDLLDGALKNRTYEALLFGNTITRSGDLYSFWHSSERLYPGLNLALYQSSKADQLIMEIRSLTDEKKRLEKMDELRRLIASDHAALFLYSPISAYVTAKDVRGIEGSTISDPSDRFSGVSSWYTTTERVWKK